MQLDGNVTVSRWSGSRDEDIITIRIQDEASRIEFVQATMSLKDFASMITGVAGQPAKLDVRALELVGLKREHKQERVFVPDSLPYSFIEDESTVRKLVRHLEVEGWKLQSPNDLRNQHNAVKRKKGDDRREDGQYYMATFVRWIKPETQPEVVGVLESGSAGSEA